MSELNEDTGSYENYECDPYSVAVYKKTYPTKVEISGVGAITKIKVETQYSLNLSDENENTEFTGTIYTDWSLSGDAYNSTTSEGKRYVDFENKESAMFCTLIANELSNTTFTLTAKVYRMAQGERIDIVEVSKLITLKDPDVILVPSENYALFMRLYSFGFTDSPTKLTRERARSIKLETPGTDGMAFKNLFKNYKGIKTNSESYNYDYPFNDFSIFKEFTNIYEIAPSMFQGCTYLKTIDIPTYVSVISANAFDSCSSLTTVNSLVNVSEISDNAFKSCVALTKFNVPDNTTKLGTGVFRNCSKLQEVTFGTGVTEIPSELFVDDAELTTVTFKGDITTIGNKAFSGCRKLKKLVIPKTLKEIAFTSDSTPFIKCNEISFEGGNDVYVVENGTLYFNDTTNNCKWILKQNRNAEVKTDEDLLAAAYSFCGMNKSDFTMPSNIVFNGTNIMNGSSGNSVKLTTLFENHKLYDEFFSETSYAKYYFANSETLIPKSCFLGCSSITTLELPNTITKIDDKAFAECTSLTSIVIPSSVNKIGNDVFKAMFFEKSKNYSIKFEPITPPERVKSGGSNNQIINDVGNVKMFVNGDSLDAYEAAWPDYTEYLMLNSLPDEGYFRIVENGEIYYSQENIGETVSDVTVGGLSVVQNENGYYKFENAISSNSNLAISRNGVGVGTFSKNYCTVFIGDNTSLYTGTGIDFTRGIYSNNWLSNNGIITKNSSNLWNYNAQVKGLKTNGANSFVQMNLKQFANPEDGYVYIRCGQLSESHHDFLQILGRNGDNEFEAFPFEILKPTYKYVDDLFDSAASVNTYVSLRDLYSNDALLRLPLYDEYKFNYRKDGSKDVYLDAFWIYEIGEPVFIEPDLADAYVETLTINVSTNDLSSLPEETKIRITNGTYFDNEFIVKDNKVVVKLPKNEKYEVSSNDYMVGSKYYTAFNPITVDTSGSVTERTVRFNGLIGEYVMYENGDIVEYDVNTDLQAAIAYIYGTTDADYYVYKSTLTNLVWSTKTVENEDKFYVSIADDLFTKFTDGYENSLGLVKLFNGGSYSEKFPALNGAMNRVNVLTDKFTWYLPSSYEIGAITESTLVKTITNGKSLWTSNLVDKNNAWCYNNGMLETQLRTNANEIIIFGRRKL